MKLPMILYAYIAFFGFHCIAMEYNKAIIIPEQHDSLGSIQTTCFALLDALDAQPICNYDNKTYKVLPVEKYDYCRVIELINKEAQKRLKKKNILKSVFGFGTGYSVRNVHGELVYCGIQENFYNIQPYTSCSMEKLKKVFSSVMHEIITNWNRTTLSEHPNMLFTQNESKWSLLIKKKILACEETVFSFILSLLQLEKKAHCDGYWKRESENCSLIYFWIKKKYFEEVVQKLYLEIG